MTNNRITRDNRRVMAAIEAAMTMLSMGLEEDRKGGNSVILENMEEYDLEDHDTDRIHEEISKIRASLRSRLYKCGYSQYQRERQEKV